MAKTINYENMNKRQRAEKVKKFFKAANCPERQDWIYWSKECSDFYYDKQLSPAVLQKLEQAHMPTFTINRITPAIEIMKYFLTANNPRWKTIGRDNSGFDTNMGLVHDALVDYGWTRVYDGQSVYSQVVHDAIVNQKGYFFVYDDKNADNGMGEVIIDFINPKNVYMDKNSKDKFGRDAGYMLVAFNDTKSALKQKLPDFVKEITAATGGLIDATRRPYWVSDSMDSITEDGIDISSGDQDELVGYYECYSKIKIPYVTFEHQVPPSEEEMERIKKLSQIRIQEAQKEIEIRLKEIAKQLDIEVKKGMLEERAKFELEKATKEAKNNLMQIQQQTIENVKSKILQTKEEDVTEKEYLLMIKNEDFKKAIVPNSYNLYYKTRVMIECVVGETLLYSKILPYEHYPILPIPFIHTGSPYSLGAIKYAIGKQKEINRAHQIMIHHANLMSNPNTWAKQGSIINETKALTDKATAGGIMYYEGDMPPVDRPPQPLNSAFYTIQEQSKADIDFILGIDPRMMGITNVGNEPYRTTMMMDKVGTRRLQMFLNQMVEPGLELLGRIFLEHAKNIYTAHKVWRIVSPEAGNEDMSEREFEINKPIINELGKVIGKMFDYQSTQFDVRFVSGSVWPTSKEADEEKYYTWWKEKFIDRQSALQNIDIKDKTGILKRIDERKMLESQNKQMGEEIKSLKGDNQTLHRQIVQMGIKLEQDKAGNEIRKDVLETEAYEEVERGRFRNELDKVLNEFKMIAKEMKNEKKIDKSKKTK